MTDASSLRDALPLRAIVLVLSVVAALVLTGSAAWWSLVLASLSTTLVLAFRTVR